MTIILSASRSSPFTWCILAITIELALASAAEPDIKECCRRHGVDTVCVDTLCDIHKPPDEFASYEATGRCGKHLPAITSCLADGRNHTTCCHDEAADVEQTSCFDFCDGSAKPQNASNSYRTLNAPYLTCLTFNSESIYRCLSQGYQSNPGPPQHVTAHAVTQVRADISWESPTVYPLFVDEYKVFFGPLNGDDTWTEAKTKLKQLTLHDLQPDTKYRVHVVASSANERHQSLKSDEISFVTKGVRPHITPYEQEVGGTSGSKQTIVCQIKVPGIVHRHLQIVWQKRNRHGRYRTLHHRVAGSKKYSLDAYADSSAASRQPRNYVSALTIHNVAGADFGHYRCVAKNKFGNASADILLQQSNHMPIPSVPPNVTACCERAGVRPQCLAACTQGGGGKSGWRKSETGALLDHACVMDVPKLLSCSIQGLKQGACCLKRRVPTHCLSLCDMREGNADMDDDDRRSQLPLLSCLAYTSDIFACQLEAKLQMPSAPLSLAVSRDDSSSLVVVVRWERSARADIYNVFYREADAAADGGWQRVTTSDVQARLTGLRRYAVYDVVVVAANSSGSSESSKTLRVTVDGTPNRRSNRDVRTLQAAASIDESSE